MAHLKYGRIFGIKLITEYYSWFSTTIFQNSGIGFRYRRKMTLTETFHLCTERNKHKKKMENKILKLTTSSLFALQGAFAIFWSLYMYLEDNLRLTEMFVIGCILLLFALLFNFRKPIIKKPPMLYWCFILFFWCLWDDVDRGCQSCNLACMGYDLFNRFKFGSHFVLLLFIRNPISG